MVRTFYHLAKAVPVCAVGLALAGCTMGNMMSGGTTDSSQYANLSATQTQIAEAQTNALPAIATECPPIRVRPGGEAMFNYGSGQVGNARDLRYQGIIEEQTRNCVVSNGRITVSMGVSGRVLLGPAGTETQVTAPIRFAVERDGMAVFSEKYELAVAIMPPAQSGSFSKVVDNVSIPYMGGETITIWVGFDPR